MTFLEEEKVSMEVELEDILKKLANANNELEAMNAKVNGLENELQQEKMKRQAKYLDGKVSPEKKIEKKNLKNVFVVIISMQPLLVNLPSSFLLLLPVEKQAEVKVQNI